MPRAIVILGPAYFFISVKIVALNRFYIISIGTLTLYHSGHRREMGFGALRGASFKKAREYATQCHSTLRKERTPLNQKQHFLKFFLLSISHEINTPYTSQCTPTHLTMIHVKSVTYIVYHYLYTYESCKDIVIHFANSQCCDNPWLLESVLSARILFLS